MPDNKTFDDAGDLSRYWDAILRGEGNPEPGELDCDSIAFVTTFQRAARAEFPAGTGDLALAAVMSHISDQRKLHNGKGTHMDSVILIPGSGRSMPRPRPMAELSALRPRRWQRAFSALSAAALILVLVGSIYFSIQHSNHGALPPLLVATPEAQPASGDVPMYKGNPGRTGVNPGPGPQGAPAVLWSVKLGGQINSSPAIVGDVLYVGSDDGGLYALNKTTGATIWRFAAESAVNSSPAVVNGIAYAGSEDGTMYAVDTATGTEVWRKAAAAPDAGPVVEGGVLYTGADDGNLYALDAATGAEIWKTSLGDAGKRSATYANGIVYATSADGMLHAVDDESGVELWTYAGASGTPVVSDGMVFQDGDDASGGYFLAGLDARTGVEIWRVDSVESFAPPAVSDGVVYAPNDDGSMYSFEAATGEQRWQFKAGDFNDAPPSLVGQTLYFGSHDRQLYALSAASGEELWRYETDGEIAFGPVVTGGVAYVGTFSGTLFAISGSANAPVQPIADPTTLSSELDASTPFAATPTTELVWSTSGVVGEFYPGDIAVSPSGAVYVIDIERNRIGVFDSAGVFTEWWGKTGVGPGEFFFNNSTGSSGDLDIDADGNIYVIDGMNNRIQKFDASRTFLSEWGSFGADSGQFNIPFGEVDSTRGLVLVADAVNNRIQVFDLDGNFLDKWGGYGFDNGLFRQPLGVGYDTAGNVYVVEQNGHRIQKFDANGRFLSSFGGGQGTGPGEFGQTWDLVIDSSGNIFVADYDNNRIQVFNPEGTVIAIVDSIPGLTAFNGLGTLEMDADGYLYIGEEFNGRVSKVKITLPES